MSTDYLLTSSIDPVYKGQVFEEGLPRHITIQQWFTLERRGAFVNALQNFATTLTPFEITGTEEAMFGPHEDVRVRRVRNVAKLAMLHDSTLEMIERYGRGSMRNPEWAGDGYNPHVSYVDGIALEEGEVVILKTIELIRRDPGSRTKVAEQVLPFSRKR